MKICTIYPQKSSFETPSLDAFFELLWMFGKAALNFSQEMSHCWWRQFFHGAKHRHSQNAQLEVPDPLEAEDERDLFA